MTDGHTFKSVTAITCYAWNKDRTQIAFSPNNHTVELHQRSGSGWNLLNILKRHDLRVTGVDWAPNNNRIVTCAADRNAYVWNQDSEGNWNPELVLLRINRAATCVKWSPNENKFAVGSGERLVCVCHYESEMNFWVSKHIKKAIHSTVSTLDWHPNNVLLATGSADFKVRVFSAYVKNIEKTPEPTPWGTKMPFGQLMAEYANYPAGGGWIHCVSFSPDGSKVAWVAHDSSITVADPSKGNGCIKLKTEFLPFISCIWISHKTIVAAGHSCIPMLYTLSANNDQLVFGGKLETPENKKKSEGISAMQKWTRMVDQATNESFDNNLDSIHQNTITSLRIYSGNKDKATKICTSGLDGQMVIWDINSLERSIKGLKIE